MSTLEGICAESVSEGEAGIPWQDCRVCTKAKETLITAWGLCDQLRGSLRDIGIAVADPVNPIGVMGGPTEADLAGGLS